MDHGIFKLAALLFACAFYATAVAWRFRGVLADSARGLLGGWLALTPLGRLAAAVFASAAIVYAATKGPTNGPDGASAPMASAPRRMAPQSASDRPYGNLVWSPFFFVRYDLAPGESAGGRAECMDAAVQFPTNFTARGLSFFDFARRGEDLAWGLAWPVDAKRSDAIDLYAGWSLARKGDWMWLDRIGVSGARSNVVMGVRRWDGVIAYREDHEGFPSNATTSAVFLAADWALDTDEDGLPDGDERYIHGSDPCNPDSDGDGLWDGEEAYWGSDPLNPDTDGDGLGDEWEMLYGDLTEPVDAIAAQDDWDEDGLSYVDECRHGTNPYVADTDWDGLPDGWEVAHGLDPLSDGGDDGADGDFDGDGLENRLELLLDCDPGRPDTDGDGLVDSIDRDPTEPDGDCHGQCDAWLRASAWSQYQVLPDEDYTNFVDLAVGVGVELGEYKLTAHFPEAPAEPTMLRVGGLRVMVNAAGDYPFLLAKGVEYGFETCPFAPDVVYSATDDLAAEPLLASHPPPSPVGWTPTGRLRLEPPDGTVPGLVCWPPSLVVAPDVADLGVGVRLSAELRDSFSGGPLRTYAWSCDDPNVRICPENPYGSSVWVSCSGSPPRAEATLSVTAADDTGAVTSSCTFAYGTGDMPSVGPANALPAAAATNAYCWIDVRTSGSRARVVFAGDGPSDYPDPDFMAEPGETYRVTLLIGKTYRVTSTRPIEVTDRSSGEIVVSDVGTHSFTVRWPVTFTVAEGRAADRRLLGATWNEGGRAFHVTVRPSWLGGTVEWWNDSCCPVTGDGTNFVYSCDNACTCQGCAASGSYVYAGYALPLVGVACGCRVVPDQGPAGLPSFGFTKDAVFYEDPYTNLPGVVVHPARSNTVLRCVARGGTYGGRLTLALNEAGRRKLARVGGNALPEGVLVPAGTERTFETEYAPLEPSGGVGDIVATATFVEEFLGTTVAETSALTSVRLRLEAVYDAPENHNPSRHVYGVGEKVEYAVVPPLAEITLSTRKLDTGDDDPESEYELFDGRQSVDASSVRTNTCPISANYRPPIKVTLGNASYAPAITIVEPQSVVTPGASQGANVLDMFYAGNRYCWPEGTVGAACLVTTNYIGPMHVSFQGIAVSELPVGDFGYQEPDDEDVITGCFANGHSRTHTASRGAGRAWHIRAGNFWFVDGARMSSPEVDWSPDSVLSWKIPVGWHRIVRGNTNDWDFVMRADNEIMLDSSSRRLLIGGRKDAYRQRWHIDPAGNFRTDKFGHWILRSPNCIVILDGSVIQISHP